MSTTHTRHANATPQPARTAPLRTRKNATAVHIDIGHLSLHGYTQPQQQRFMQTLEATLSQLAMDKRNWSLLASRHIADLAPMHPRPGTTPESAARQLARQLFRLLDRQQSEVDHG